jgi:predicted DNA-binding ribbon-helix-helix protein
MTLAAAIVGALAGCASNQLTTDSPAGVTDARLAQAAAIGYEPANCHERAVPRATLIRKRSIAIAGHSTSLSLEEEFWQDLRAVARRRGLSLNALIGAVDAERRGNLSSALRLFIRDCYRRGELGPAVRALPD